MCKELKSIRLFQWTSSFWSICQIYAFQVHILSIFGPHFCSWRSPFHSKLGNHLVPILKNLGHHSMWAGVNISLKNQHFFTDPENDPARDSSSICGSSMSPQLYHCFYCHMLYDGNGQGWGAYWNLTPTVASLYMMRYWSGIVNFGWRISIRCRNNFYRKTPQKKVLASKLPNSMSIDYWSLQDPSATEQAALKIQTAYKAMKERKEKERVGKMNGNNTRVISM